MQGRLSPPENGRIQVFPSATWRDEFDRAREAGLYCIEWIYDAETDAANPMRTDEGIAEMRDLSERSGVRVLSVCADYYMTETLVNDAGEANATNIAHLAWLLGRGAMLGIQYMVLPFVDSSKLRTQQAIDGIVAVLAGLAPRAVESGIELHVESDLPAPDLIHLLDGVGSSFVRANYDIGNSASLGHPACDELPLLAPWLGSVHVKDRVLGGGTVPLGTGAADLPVSFELIRRAGFAGPLILQVARGPAGNEVDTAIRHRQFVERLLNTE